MPKPGPSTPKAAKAKKTTAETNADSILKLNGAVNAQVTAEQVAERAYFRWLERGCPMGSAEQDWIEAEQELGLHQ